MDILDKISVIIHSSVRIDGGKVIYFDPYKLPENMPKADIIFITHEHRDHMSPEDVAKIATDSTVIVIPGVVEHPFKGKVVQVTAGDETVVEGIPVKVVPAYNTNKQFHTKDKGWVGYIVTLDSTRIYFAGDTDRIPEMKDFDVDIALLPVSGTYVMTAEEAAQAALDIKPKIAIPMHYGTVVGNKDDAQKFADLLKGKIEVIIKH
ncbi:MAG: MBL fold metallo-hydrolase [Candidatus Delongbacteria bacterium]|nr:MBL fold metallo-hydrolase [Candidatus Delongbacteria bacterium]